MDINKQVPKSTCLSVKSDRPSGALALPIPTEPEELPPSVEVPLRWLHLGESRRGPIGVI